MSELRQKFESLPEVIDSLSCHIRIGSDGLYYTSLVNFEKLTAWLNGAWFAFQEQQAKIDLIEKEIVETQEFLNKQNHIKQAKIDKLQARVDEALNTLCKLQYSSGERIYNDVGSILKGNKDEK